MQMSGDGKIGRAGDDVWKIMLFEGWGVPRCIFLEAVPSPADRCWRLTAQLSKMCFCGLVETPVVGPEVDL